MHQKCLVQCPHTQKGHRSYKCITLDESPNFFEPQAPPLWYGVIIMISYLTLGWHQPLFFSSFSPEKPMLCHPGLFKVPQTVNYFQAFVFHWIILFASCIHTVPILPCRGNPTHSPFTRKLTFTVSLISSGGGPLVIQSRSLYWASLG